MNSVSPVSASRNAFAGAMRKSDAKEIVESILARLGIRIDGTRAWDISVRTPDFYPRVLAGGSLALG